MSTGSSYAEDLIRQMEDSVDDFSTAVTLPPACYTSPEFHQVEIERVFSREWICVGRENRIPKAGDFFTATVIGEPLIIARSSDGTVKAMSSICRHRGMCITAPDKREPGEWLEPAPETSGNAQTFRCPYHWWVYDLDGRLVGAPEMSRTKDFDPATIKLPPVRVELWRGFIFVNFDQEAAPLAPAIAPLDEVLGAYPLEDMVSLDMGYRRGIPFNWKIMIENAMDRYHADRLHAGIHDFARSDAGTYHPFDPETSVMIDTIKTPHLDAGSNPTFKAFFPVDPLLSEEERGRALYAFVAPSVIFSFWPDSVGWLSITPEGPTSHSQVRGLLVHPAAMEMENFDALIALRRKAIENFNAQDLPVDVSVQAGMRSRFAPRGRFSWQEEMITQINTWLLARLKRTGGAAKPSTTANG